MFGLTTLRMHRHLWTLSIPGRQDPPAFRSRLAMPHWPCSLTQFVFFPFPAPCRLSTLALAPVPDPSFFFFWGTAARMPPRQANPSPLLFPPSTQARTRSAPWSTLSPPRDPPVFFFHVASTSRLLGCARVSYIYSTPMQPAKRTADRMQIKATRIASGHLSRAPFPAH